MSDAIAGPAVAVTAPRRSRLTSRLPKLPANALNSDAMLQSTMLSERIGIRLIRSTSKPTGIVNTAPTSTAAELSSPISVLLM